LNHGRDPPRRAEQLTTVGLAAMEQLADDGDGDGFVDTIDEAERLVDEVTSTLVTVALDAKVQVAWERAAVERYRLIGFENRAIDDDQFRDDSVEAGAIGAGHTVTALYELKLGEGAAGALGTVSLRWTEPVSGEVREIAQTLEAATTSESFAGADRHFRLAATVAAFAEVLRDSYWARQFTLGGVATEAAARLEEFPEDPVVAELAALAATAALADQ
jgi:Ca-activated chloride channel family protein